MATCNNATSINRYSVPNQARIGHKSWTNDHSLNMQ